MSDIDDRFDRDPEALAWARDRVRRYLDRLADFERQAEAKGDPITEYGCAVARVMAERHFLGDGACTLGTFDERMPQFLTLQEAETHDRG